MNIPWMEKYRPNNIDEIILSQENELLLKNIIEKKYFPNMMFYGSPGTGKTTTIINLIKEYQNRNENGENNNNIIHLNASDDRGIDVIRNIIKSFIFSKTRETRFVILDEADCMTVNAQYLLKTMIKNYKGGAKFCLLCNYISKIDEKLLEELMIVRFNNLPPDKIINKLKEILEKENKKITTKKLKILQKNYGNDIRSMINDIQMNKINDYNKVFKKKNEYDKIDLYELSINVFQDMIENNCCSKLIDKMEKYIHNYYELDDPVKYFKNIISLR
uniref:AAA+ ATPase domain-containing protein n=1 Tax=viral metagenome TaxID=1070528 RepID=A0A6C0H5A8_9ZZZZ